ncbi:hypothetical protein SAMN05421640_0586 [Ekhidna lutea]|uniref:Uncharacterized protein n=1 Tax=Ekhidna lutea TaxID=447679 RepID=A0A239FB62_EKHLU|nr:hypothetical protein [Ekhidna lutea]SNS54057.1 hypothetical protein SAMN05421640_0586 [Ekhidna lutea]
MKKWITLALITIALLSFSFLNVKLHPSWNLMIAFFAIQTIILFRVDQWAPKEWKPQASLVKIIIRLLSSMVFILVLVYTQEDLYNLVIQFIIIYLIYMIFEIVEALTNLRRN